MDAGDADRRALGHESVLILDRAMKGVEAQEGAPSTYPGHRSRRSALTSKDAFRRLGRQAE
jgi:hypothetical protein